MTLAAFYEQIGGDYQKTVDRLYNEAMVRKFVLKYRQDGTFEELRAAHAAGDWETAFRAAHTLKGIALNLGFTLLFASAMALTEALRGNRPLTDESLYTAVANDQAALLAALDQLDS